MTTHRRMQPVFAGIVAALALFVAGGARPASAQQSAAAETQDISVQRITFGKKKAQETAKVAAKKTDKKPDAKPSKAKAAQKSSGKKSTSGSKASSRKSPVKAAAKAVSKATRTTGNAAPARKATLARRTRASVTAAKPAAPAVTAKPAAPAAAATTKVATVSASETRTGSEFEKCYGISRAGQDDGSSELQKPGYSLLDFQGTAYKFVPKGTCEATVTPFGFGSLEPVDNRPPRIVN